MIDDTVITFLSLLALVGLAFLAFVGVMALISWGRGLPAWAVPLRDFVGQAALPMAFAVALTCTLGSLYLSEVKNLPPCVYCWFQRICMYPQVILLGIAAIRRDVSVRWYALPLAVVGIAFSTYHYLLERFPDSVSSICKNSDTPCDTVWIWKFHFLSIPGMAWIGFLLIITLLLLARPRPAATDEYDDDTNLDRPEEVLA